MPSPPRSRTLAVSSMPIRTSPWAARLRQRRGPLPTQRRHSLIEPALSASRTHMEREVWPRQHLARPHASTMSTSAPAVRCWDRWRCTPLFVRVLRPYLPHSAPRSGPETPPRNSPTPLARARAVPSLSVCNDWARGLRMGSAQRASRQPTAMRPKRSPAPSPNAGISKRASPPSTPEAGSAPERHTGLGVTVR